MTAPDRQAAREELQRLHKQSRAVCNLLNQLAGSPPERGTAAPKDGK